MDVPNLVPHLHGCPVFIPWSRRRLRFMDVPNLVPPNLVPHLHGCPVFTLDVPYLSPVFTWVSRIYIPYLHGCPENG
jgi:hypothetical protein